MMGTIVHQLTQGLTKDEIIAAGLDPYYVNHGLGVYPSSAAGVPFTAACLQSKGDPITDLYEDMAAEGAFVQGQIFLKILGCFFYTAICLPQKKWKIPSSPSDKTVWQRGYPSILILLRYFRRNASAWMPPLLLPQCPRGQEYHRPYRKECLY